MSDAATPSLSPTSGRIHPFEAILRLCAECAPKPWYARQHAQEVGIPLEMLYYYLENLWLDGLVQKAEGSPQTGPGLTLTAAGLEVLKDPAALQRLRDGRPVIEGSQGGLVREVIRRPPRPTVTYGLLAVSLAVFAYGLVLASVNKVGFADFLMGMGNAQPILESLGTLQGPDWVRGEWWRLVTCAFVHVGVFNLIFSLLYLYRIGPRVEQMWGRARFLILYLCAGVGGSCIGVAMQPLGWPDGAWGAIYGLLGANAVWVLCNGRHLPRSVASRMRSALAMDAALLAFFVVLGLFYNSFGRTWEEIGGALAGATVALVLQAQRFGPWPWNWAAVVALLPLPWLGYTFIEHERATNPEWKGVNGQLVAKAQAEDSALEEWTTFKKDYSDRVHEATRLAYHAYKAEGGVLDEAPEDRKPDMVDRVKKHLAEQREAIKQLADELDRIGPYKGEQAEIGRKTALKFVEALNDLLATAETRLREGKEWTAQDEDKAKQVKAAADAWYALVN